MRTGDNLTRREKDTLLAFQHLVDKHGRFPMVREIATELDVTRVTTHGFLVRLTAKRFVTNAAPAEAAPYRLTGKGKRAVERLRGGLLKSILESAKALTSDERKQLMEALS